MGSIPIKTLNTMVEFSLIQPSYPIVVREDTLLLMIHGTPLLSRTCQMDPIAATFINAPAIMVPTQL